MRSTPFLTRFPPASSCTLSAALYSNDLETIQYFMRRSAPLWTVILLLAVLPSTGCLFRTRPVEETYSKTPLKQSTQAALIGSINQQAEKIKSLQATVDIDSSVGGVKKGRVTDYKEIRDYVLARKPAMLHMI